MDELRLEKDEIAVLLEALKAWESKDAGGELMTTLIEGLLVDKANPLDAARLTRDRDERRQKVERAANKRKEQSIMLQAKLLRIRDATDVDTFIAGALSSGR